MHTVREYRQTVGHIDRDRERQTEVFLAHSMQQLAVQYIGPCLKV